MRHADEPARAGVDVREWFDGLVLLGRGHGGTGHGRQQRRGPGPAGTGGITALATAQSLLIVGCNPSNNQCFNGLFDELRIWKGARTATQIHDNYNKPVATTDTALAGYWKFDEASGTTTADAVTATGHTAHNGTLKADTVAHNPTFVTPPVPLPLVCP